MLCLPLQESLKDIESQPPQENEKPKHLLEAIAEETTTDKKGGNSPGTND